MKAFIAAMFATLVLMCAADFMCGFLATVDECRKVRGLFRQDGEVAIAFPGAVVGCEIKLAMRGVR